MKLDIGAGTHKLEGYKSLGYDLEGEQDIRWNLWDLPLPFKDNEIETIHASAIMEHFPEPHCIGLMAEFYRALQSKGTIHIYVPNLTNSALLLLAARLLSLKTLPSRGNIYGTQANYQDPKTRHLSYFFRLHKYGYTAPILREMLKGAGFVDVKITRDSHWKRVAGKHEYERSSTLGWLVSKFSPVGLYGRGSKP